MDKANYCAWKHHESMTNFWKRNHVDSLFKLWQCSSYKKQNQQNSISTLWECRHVNESLTCGHILMDRSSITTFHFHTWGSAKHPSCDPFSHCKRCITSIWWSVLKLHEVHFLVRTIRSHKSGSALSILHIDRSISQTLEISDHSSTMWLRPAISSTGCSLWRQAIGT